MRSSLLARLVAGVAVPLLAAAALTGTATGASRATTAPASPDAGEPVTIRPGTLPLGEKPRVPVLIQLPGETVEGTLVHGDLELKLPPNAQLLGRSGADYLLSVDGPDFRDTSVVRLHPDGSTETVVPGQGRSFDARASADGGRVVLSRTRGMHPNHRTTVVAYDTATGTELARRVFRGPVRVVAAQGNRLWLSLHSSRTWTKKWNFATDRTRKILGQAGYLVDPVADRLGTYTADPYQGGCTVLRVLSAPRTVLNRSCTERITAISPNGRRVATVHILSDGIGHGEVLVRRAGGRLEARYAATRNGYFGSVGFENNRTVLVVATGRSKAAWVRCAAGDCERATATWPKPAF